MKHIVIALSLILGLTSAHAKDKFTYYMMTNTNSPSMKVTEPFVERLRDFYEIDWKPNVGCNAKNQVERETNPIFVELVTGQYWMSLHDGNKNCVIDLDQYKWLMIYETAYKVCVRNDSEINSFNDLIKNKNHKIAYATGTVSKLIIESINKDFDTSFKPILLRTSNDILTAMLSKDVDVGILNILTADPQQASNNIKCFATTEKNKETSLSKLAPKMNPLLSTFSLGYAVGVKNVSDDQFKNIQSTLISVLEKTVLPKNINIISIKDMSEKDLRSKVNDATVNLYEATK
jgi:tripartite-type tricarboxylate transporter receptor subunit TctC